jgi:hypothetical protein
MKTTNHYKKGAEVLKKELSGLRYILVELTESTNLKLIQLIIRCSMVAEIITIIPEP